MKSEIEIFRTGTHTDMNGRTITVSRDELVAMAQAYDPARHEAPIVVGHPKHNDPAMGWVRGLTVSDDGVLSAELHQVNPDFSEIVDKGSFKKISASLYPPGAKGNPAGDNYGLRHVGFLGGAVPAIKGLKNVQFADNDTEALTFTADFGEHGFLFRSIASAFRSLRDYLIEDKGGDVADKALPSYLIDTLAEASMATDSVPAFADQPENSEDHNGLRQGQAPARSFSGGGGVSHANGGESPINKQKDIEMDKDQIDKEFAEREAACKAREDEVARKIADFAEQQKKLREADNAAFVEAQIKAGKLAPGEKDKTLAFMNEIDATKVVSFAEGEKKTALAVFKGMFTAANPVIDFGEHTADDGKGGSVPETHEDFLEAAMAFQEEQKTRGIEIDIARAVDHVRKGTNK